MLNIFFWAFIFYFLVWPLLKKIISSDRSAMDYQKLAAAGSPEERLLTATVTLGMRLGAVDGSFDPSELQALIRAIPHQTQPALVFAQRIIADVYQGGLREFDEPALFTFLRLDPRSRTVYEPILTVLGAVARADGVIGVIERRYFYHVATLCGVHESSASSYLQDANRDSSRSHYSNSNSRARTSPPPRDSERTRHLDRLGLKAGASSEEIKKRYRELARQLHPDRVAHIGGAVEELVNREFLEIKEAYEYLIR